MQQNIGTLIISLMIKQKLNPLLLLYFAVTVISQSLSLPLVTMILFVLNNGDKTVLRCHITICDYCLCAACGALFQ